MLDLPEAQQLADWKVPIVLGEEVVVLLGLVSGPAVVELVQLSD